MHSKIMLTAMVLLLLTLFAAQIWSGKTPPLLAGSQSVTRDLCDSNPPATPDGPTVFLPITVNSADSPQSKLSSQAILQPVQLEASKPTIAPIEIAIGDVVSQTITPSETCIIYSFDATPGQTVFFDIDSVVDTGSLAWRLEDSLGEILFDDCLACGDPGVTTLTQGGAYTITVGRPNHNISGTYSFSLLPVTVTDTFAIALGDVVGDGTPDAGAGNIEVFGAHDIYTFSATAGQSVYFDMQSIERGLSVRWLLKDSSGAILFDTCLACGDPGLTLLDLGGTYTLIVGTVNSTSTGTYQFQLTEVAANDQFDIEIGDVVSDGSPSAGAGNIESAGAVDIYNFTAAAGQTVGFEMQSFSRGLAVRWKLVDSAETQLFRTCLGCGNPRDITLTLGGTYTITVGTASSSATGTYQFQTIARP